MPNQNISTALSQQKKIKIEPRVIKKLQHVHGLLKRTLPTIILATGTSRDWLSCIFFLIFWEVVDVKQQISKDVIIEEHSASDIFFPLRLLTKK